MQSNILAVTGNIRLNLMLWTPRLVKSTLPILVSGYEVPVLLRDIKWTDFWDSYETVIGQLLGAFDASP